MGEPERRLEHADERAARAALRGLAPALQLHLGELDVPVAVLVPHELVEGARGGVEAVLGEALRDLGLGALQPRDDPAVDEGELDGRVRVEPGVLALAVHQHEARGVPELVAEAAVALAALQVEVERAPVGGERGEGEAQRVGAVGGDALGVVALDALLGRLAVRGRA